jgi:hypothetical protein
MLASGLNQPGPLALSGDYLYFANNDPLGAGPDSADIVRIPLGGGSPMVLASGQGQVWAVAADANNVYWTSDGGTVQKLAIAGGAPIALASGIDHPGGLAVDATTVYFGSLYNGDVMKVPIAGGAPTTLFSGSGANVPSALGLAVDSTHLYWYANASSQLDAGLILSVPIGGGPPTTIATGQISGFGIAVDAHDVYWTNDVTLPNGNGGPQGPGTIVKAPLDGGGQPQVVATGQMFPEAIVVDANNVYWGGGVYDPSSPPPFVDMGFAPVAVASLSGGPPETVFQSKAVPLGGLVQCPGGVCWSDAAAGTVMRFKACGN